MYSILPESSSLPVGTSKEFSDQDGTNLLRACISSSVNPDNCFPNSTAPTGRAAPVPKTPVILLEPIALVSAIDISLAAL